MIKVGRKATSNEIRLREIRTDFVPDFRYN